MKNLTISTRVSVLLLVPFLLIVLYALKTGNDNYQEWRNSGTTESLMDLAITLGNVTHRLQIERGATAGFLQSRGEKFAAELPKYREETDKKLAILKDQYARSSTSGLPQAIKNAMDEVQTSLDKLGNTRATASQFNISVAEAAGYYTQTIALILKTIPVISEQSSNPAITRHVSAYLALLHAKERNGQERALMAAVFSANRIEPAQYRALLSHIAAQQAYLSSFNDFASDEMRALYKQKLAGDVVDNVENLRKTIMDKVVEGQFGIDPVQSFGSMTAKINAMHEVEEQFAGQIKDISAIEASRAHTAFIGFTVVNIALLLGLIVAGYWMVQGITRPINSLKTGIIEIQANNDLTHRLDIDGKDEIGQVAEAFNQLMGNMQNIIRQANENAQQVLQLAAQLTANSSQVADSSQQQSDSASSMAAAVEEMTVSIDQVSEHAKGAYAISHSGNELSIRGGEVILKVAEDMRGIAETVHASSTIIEGLGQQSNQIHSIVQAIKEIADQTNLLALNAAIEAARAGEQGRGFAVVADEVRKLAERTSRSTEEIAGMILKIQSGTGQAVASMEVGVERVNEGVAMAGQASDSIRQIQSGSQQISTAVSEISAALKEQSMTSTEIAKLVEHVAQMAEQNNNAVQGNAITARQMEELAANLQGAIEKFRV